MIPTHFHQILQLAIKNTCGKKIRNKEFQKSKMGINVLKPHCQKKFWGILSRLPKKPSLWRFSIPITKFSLSFAMKRDKKGYKSHRFWKPDFKTQVFFRFYNFFKKIDLKVKFSCLQFCSSKNSKTKKKTLKMTKKILHKMA